MWRNCGITTDYIQTALLPWEWITGGNFSLVLVSVFVVMSYIKYHKPIYPVLIGLLFLPVSFFLFPDQFLSFAILAVGLVIGLAIWVIVYKQTKEYD